MDVKLFKKNPIVRGFKNLSFLTIGLVLSTIINILGYVIILNLIDKNDYGIFSTVGAVVGIFSLLTMQMLSKVVLREGSKDYSFMKKVMERTIGLKVGMILISLAICYAVTIVLPYEYSVKLFIVIFSFDLIYQGLNSYLFTIFQAAEKMQYITLLNIVHTFLRVATLILVLLLGLPLICMFLTIVISDGIALFINWKLGRRFVKFKFRRGFNVGKDFTKAAVVFSIISFIGSVSPQVNIVMISFLSDYVDTGIYSAALRFIQPITQYRNIVSLAFFPMFVKMFHKGPVSGRRLFKASFFMGAVFFVVSLLGSLIGPVLIDIFFPKWGASASIFSVLILYTAFTYMEIPFYNALTSSHNEKLVIIIVLVPAIMNIFLNLVFFNYFGLIGIAYSTLVVQFIGYLLFILVTWTVMKRQGKII